MKTRDFAYDLPQELIAQHPLPGRSDSRLLVLKGASTGIDDQCIRDLPSLLEEGDLLVFNDTRVIPARLYGCKQTGGRVEVLVERVLDAHRLLAQVRASKPPRPGTQLKLGNGIDIEVIGRQGDFYELQLQGSQEAHDVLERYGHVPLPPYIERTDQAADIERYQTVYAQRPGAVAAPTAGLHFDLALLDALAVRGVEHTFVTLHVGAGTFQPVRVEEINAHRMHAEYVEVGEAVCEAVSACRTRGGRVIAVGTTAVRSLEAAAATGELSPLQGDTDIFITPGYDFKVVDALLTNFHLPESTLLMLVSALGGYQEVMAAYRHAIAQGYRFYSYGDAMFVEKKHRQGGK